MALECCAGSGGIGTRRGTGRTHPPRRAHLMRAQRPSVFARDVGPPQRLGDFLGRGGVCLGQLGPGPGYV